MPKTEKKLMTVTQYAAYRGCTAPAVRKAIKTNRISTVDGKIDPARADADWLANTRPQARRTRRPSVGTPVGDYHGARARREAAEARLAELKVAEAEGEVVRTAAVTQTWQRLLGNCRARLLAITARIAPRMAGAGVAEAAALIEGEILEALAELSGDGLPHGR